MSLKAAPREDLAPTSMQASVPPVTSHPIGFWAIPGFPKDLDIWVSVGKLREGHYQAFSIKEHGRLSRDMSLPLEYIGLLRDMPPPVAGGAAGLRSEEGSKLTGQAFM